MPDSIGGISERLKMEEKAGSLKNLTFASQAISIRCSRSRLDLSIVERRMKAGERYLDYRLIKGYLISHDSWLPWKQISIYSR